MWKFWKKKSDEEEVEENLQEGSAKDESGNEEKSEEGSVEAQESDRTAESQEGEAAESVAETDHADEGVQTQEIESGQVESKPSFWSWLGFGKNNSGQDTPEESAEGIVEEGSSQDASLEVEKPKEESPVQNLAEAEVSASEAETTLAEENAQESSEKENENTDDATADALEENKASEEKKGFFARLKAGLSKTRDNIVRGIDRLFSGNALDDDFYEELEEILIMGDIGVNATTAIIERLKAQVKEQHVKEPKECKELLIQSIREQMEVGETAYDFETKQSIIMVIGVNGVGKTTTVGKLAWKLKDEGKKVLIAAADTFRAAAGDQLAEWASRAGVPMIGGKEGADPASVVFDAVNAAKARGVDILLIDTAGRLHNKKNLMEELRKMNRIVDREFPNAHRENLIVLDGTTGQNALVQAREFGDVADLTGIVLTKMDGTAKGGIAVAIQSELKIPVKYIGVGETTQDLQKFDPDDFVRALFDVDLSKDENGEGSLED